MPNTLCFPAAAEVQVAISTLMITEGSGDTVCVSLTATSGSPTSLENPLIVDLTTNLNAEAGSGFNIGKSLVLLVIASTQLLQTSC